jgi:hypothetical protein
MSLFLDRRQAVTGRPSQMKLDNYINMDKYIKKIADVSANTALTAATEDINTLREVVLVEETYTALPTDYRILVDQTSVEAVEINLPTAVGVTGKTYFIQAITFTDAVTVLVDGVELINGDTEIVLNAQYEYVEVVAANGQWYIVNSNYTTP